MREDGDVGFIQTGGAVAGFTLCATGVPPCATHIYTPYTMVPFSSLFHSSIVINWSFIHLVWLWLWVWVWVWVCVSLQLWQRGVLLVRAHFAVGGFYAVTHVLRTLPPCCHHRQLLVGWFRARRYSTILPGRDQTSLPHPLPLWR